MIDAGEGVDAPPGTALNWLTRHGIHHINLVVISHFHKDHYRVLRDFIEAGIVVDRVAVNVPAYRGPSDNEPFKSGFDRADVDSTLEFLRARGVPYFTPSTGERLIAVDLGQGQFAALDVVCLYDGIATPVGRTDINDTSIILRLSDGPTRALFTGDLNWKLGAWLADSSFDLAADILKAPHHGTEHAAPDSFFDRVQPQAVLVPAPKALWLSIRSKRIRSYFSEHNIPAYVSGVHGDVIVTIQQDGFSVATESTGN
jgi:competence protein ComEC